MREQVRAEKEEVSGAAPAPNGEADRILHDIGRSTIEILSEAMAVPIARCDRELKYLWVNEQFTKWFGRPADAIIGRPILEVMGERAFAQISPYVARVLAGDRVEYVERVDYKGRGCRWINAFYSPTFDDTGAVTGWVAIIFDISDRKQLGEALEQSEQRFTRFMEQLPGLAWIKDLHGRYLFANDMALKAFQCSRERLYGKSDEDVFAPQTAEQFKQNDQLALASKSGVQIVETLEHDDGVVHHSLVSKFPIFGSDNMPAYVGGMAIDITDRLQAKEVLAESELRFRQLAENINEVFWMTDPHTGAILYVSPAYERIWGQSCQSLLAQSGLFLESIHPDDREFVLAKFDRQRQGETTDVTYRIVRPDGALRWVRDRGFPVRDPQGEVYRVVGIADDITEIVNADRRKDEFLATLAHELRNPLAPLTNAIELMSDHADAEVREQAGSIMRRQLGHLVRLIDDLLDISRVTRGKIELRRERVELANVIRSSIETAQPLLDARGHTLSVSLPASALDVDADRVRLAQVFANLLHNAAKFTENGGRIWVTVEQTADEAVVAVGDTGVGIADKHRTRIFEMFSQVTPALERTQGGLGIGLALVRGFVELHGGTVECRSDGPGKGSEFIVRLPLAQPLQQDVSERPVPTSKATSQPKRRILVADDLRDAVDSLALMLRFCGHEVQTAADGLEAIELAASFRPEIALLDIGMPRMNGYDAARRIREQSWGKEMLLVAITGWGQDDDRRRAKEAGFDHHLVKPVDFNALRSLLAATAIK